MMELFWVLGFLVCFGILAYKRSSLSVWTIGLGLFFILMSKLSSFSSPMIVTTWVIFALILIPLYSFNIRKKIFSKYVLKFYRKSMPSMSSTEREALSAGTIGWEGDLFRGDPDWNKLLKYPKPSLSKEEQAFLDGPCEELCKMTNDWEITHKLLDLPPKIWQFLKDKGFFGLKVPKKYGGKEFSAYALSRVLVKVYGQSITVGTTIAVPNSLGPAELLLHYGTEEQKDHYLPRLASGKEVPCFALTGLQAGSDAGSMSDKGYVEWGTYKGEKTLGIRLNFNKRYITLAPVATVIGLAFKLYDPDQLIGKTKSLGVTCALIPRDTEGVSIGRRHLPCNVPFQNGPISGTDVFVPLDFIIGGTEQAGSGWSMLMECLAAGRAITLPASSIGTSKILAYAGGAYARVRRQFKMPIGRFEGVGESLAAAVGYLYIMDSTSSFTAAVIDSGEKPALASAITKYHVTELGRKVGNAAMDIHGGKAIMMGPKNYIMQAYQAIPISITVEGANILTRSMIIFGQGAMRCHPYVFKEFDAASLKDEEKSLKEFDKALMGHIYYLITNFVRTFALGITAGKLIKFSKGSRKGYFQQASRFSAAFAMISDISLLLLGGSLKRRECISARLGDILSYLYLLSSVLKHYSDQGEPKEDLPLVRWSALYCLYQIQQKFDHILKNFPNRFLGSVLRWVIFPFGKRFTLPSDKLDLKVAKLFLSSTDTRYRLSEGLFTTNVPNNVIATLEDALLKVEAADEVEKIVKQANKDNKIASGTLVSQMQEAYEKKIINKDQFEIFKAAEEARLDVIGVDDFSDEELLGDVGKNNNGRFEEINERDSIK